MVQGSEFGFQVLGLKPQALSLRFPISGLKFQVSGFSYDHLS